MQQRTLAGQPEIGESLRRRCRRRRCVCCRCRAARTVRQVVQLGTDGGQVAAHDGVLQLIEPVAVVQLLCICCGSRLSSEDVCRHKQGVIYVHLCCTAVVRVRCAAANLTLHLTTTHPASAWSPRPGSSRTRPERSPCPTAGQCGTSRP